jgi:ABC-type Fe3+ transport system substrate-binding protein
VTPQVASQLAVVHIPDALNTLASYPIATVQGAPNRAGAAVFTALVLSPTGQSILAKWGFTPVGATAAEADALGGAFDPPGHVDQHEGHNAAVASVRGAP